MVRNTFIAAVFTITSLSACAAGDEAEPLGERTAALAERPYFHLPFTCGEVWALTTYAGHNPEDKKIDFLRQGGAGRAVLAPAAGVVHERFAPGGVEIDHGNGWFTVMLHMKDITVSPGQVVARGQHIGTVWNVGTGVPHLHAEQLFDDDGDGDVDNADIRFPVWQGKLYALTEAQQPFPEVESNNCGGTSPAPSTRAMSDVNRDGLDDIVGISARNQGGMNIDVWLSQGSTIGGGNPGSSAADYATTRTALGDFDADGATDLFAALPRAGGGTDFKVSLGRPGFPGFAGFVDVGSTAGVPARIHAGDVDGDGRADVIGISPTSQGGTNIVTYLSDGTHLGGGNPVTSGAAFNQLRTAVGDVNADGVVDLIGALPLNQGGTRFILSLGRPGHATFAGFQPAGTTGGEPVRIQAGDVDGDGKEDLVGIAPASAGTSIITWLSQGKHFGGGNPGTSAAQFATLRTTLGDVNGDGVVDLIGALPGAEGGTSFMVSFGQAGLSTFTGFVPAGNTAGTPSVLVSR